MNIPCQLRKSGKRVMLIGAEASFEEFKIDRSAVARTLSLVNLAPDIVTAIFNGTAPDTLTFAKLVSGIPDDWQEQSQNWSPASPMTGRNNGNSSAWSNTANPDCHSVLSGCRDFSIANNENLTRTGQDICLNDQNHCLNVFRFLTRQTTFCPPRTKKMMRGRS